MGAQRLDLAITAVGMVSSLGLDATTGCAAARAGMVRPTPRGGLTVQAGDTDEEVEVLTHSVPTVTDGFTGLGRLAQLGGAALADLWDGLSPNEEYRTGCLVNVPSGLYHTQWERWREAEGRREPVTGGEYEMEWRQNEYASRLLPTMLRLAELDVDTEHQALIFEDQTGLATMLLRAASWLAAGQIEQCIVGGIASHLEPYLLEALLGLSMIKTPAQANGFLPGEGAAFLLVEPYSGQTDTLGTINVTGLDAEPEDRFTGDQPRGEALARVTDAVLRTSGFIPDIIVGDLNGEVWRAADWGYALSRLYAEHDAALDRPVWYPAASFGDTGAAAGLIGVALTLHLFQRVARIERAFLHLASSSGARAALALSAARN